MFLTYNDFPQAFMYNFIISLLSTPLLLHYLIHFSHAGARRALAY